MDMLIVFGAKYLIYVIALVFVGFLVWRRAWRLGVWSAIALVGVYLAARIAGLFYNHVQPFAAQNFTPLITHAIDNSFPSDHTAVATVMALIVFLHNRVLGVVLLVLALSVGIARVYAGVHYPIDIVASVILALFVVVLVRVASRYIRHS